MAVETLFKSDSCAIGLSNGVFLCVWVGEATVEAADQIEQSITKRSGEFPKGIGLVTIVPEHAPPPKGPARNRIAELLGRAQNVKGSAVCFEGSGLRATLVRSIVTGITLIGRMNFPHKVFAGLEAGTAFVHACMVQGGTPVPEKRVLIDEIAAWRQSLTAQPGAAPRAS
ncbi:MAG: hypothetical protein JNM17_02940 [Archangium sp.]|nr:hypothetical protein [Archangium sp.]